MSTSYLVSEEKKTTGRLHELDAIRGIAAVIVVFHHFILMKIDNYTIVSHPIHRFLQLAEPIWNGHAAVLLFFVLSGLVLALPYVNGKPQTYRTFLIRRVFRIYLPYLFALALAITGDYFLNQHFQGMSQWSNETWSAPVNKSLIVQHILFLGTYDSGQFNTAFWTLIHEMRISLVYPLLLITILRLKPVAALLSAVALSLLGILGTHLYPSGPHLQTTQLWMTVHYIAFFVCGILLANNLQEIGRWYRRQSRVSHVCLASASILLYCYGPLAIDHFHSYRALGDWILGAGAVGLIVVGVHSDTAKNMLNLGLPRYLGRISYSLYLVHGTILFAVAALLHSRVSFAIILPIYLVLAFSVSSAFCFLVEEPFMRLGRRLTSRKAETQSIRIAA